MYSNPLSQLRGSEFARTLFFSFSSLKKSILLIYDWARSLQNEKFSTMISQLTILRQKGQDCESNQLLLKSCHVLLPLRLWLNFDLGADLMRKSVRR